MCVCLSVRLWVWPRAQGSAVCKVAGPGLVMCGVCRHLVVRLCQLSEEQGSRTWDRAIPGADTGALPRRLLSYGLEEVVALPPLAFMRGQL